MYPLSHSHRINKPTRFVKQIVGSFYAKGFASCKSISLFKLNEYQILRVKPLVKRSTY